MFKKILSVLLALCLVGCSQPKVEDLEVFQGKLKSNLTDFTFCQGESTYLPIP